jgi:hypothetical protein
MRALSTVSTMASEFKETFDQSEVTGKPGSRNTRERLQGFGEPSLDEKKTCSRFW